MAGKHAWRRVAIRCAAALLSVTALLGAFLWWTAWRRLPHVDPPTGVQLTSAVMTRAQYNEIISTHRRPYVYQITGPATGAVLIYGAEHSKRPADPQFVDIQGRWDGFRPTVALCESTLGILFPHLMDPVREFGEPGFVHALARRDKVPTYTWEPRNEVLVAHLVARHSKQRVAARLILGPYFSNLRHGRPGDPEAFVEEFRRKRSAWPGLDRAFVSVSDIDVFWEREFPSGPDWRDVSDEHGLPGFLNEMDLNAVRDEHFAAIVIDLVRRGHRVFAICGLSHAVKLEPALQATIATAGPN